MSGNQPDFPDIGGYGNHEYGNRVGIFRILAVLDKYGITPTLALDKAVADHYPFLIQEGQRRDAEFIAHGLSRRRLIHIGMSEDEERQYIRDWIAAVEQATGTRPVGWSGPDFQETPHTPDLLAAAGIRYVCDWGNDEQPYKMTPQTGELYSLGVMRTSTTTTSTCTGGVPSTRSTGCGASGSIGRTPTARRPAG